MKNIFKITKFISFLSLIYLIESIFMYIFFRHGLDLFMAWNLFLALIPLYAAIILCKNLQSNKIVTVFSSFMFIFFFPNSPYLITDYIHVGRMDFFTYSDRLNIIAWARLLHITFAIFLGTLAGMLSLYLIHRLLLAYKNKMFSNISIVIISLLSGYAIYIGRFLRFNSWDVLSPIFLTSELLKDFDIFTIVFSFLLAIYTLFVYIIFYVFFHADYKNKNLFSK